MQNYFNNLIKVANTACHSKELCLLNISGEYSDFVRFNQSKIRQAGSVEQAYLNISLISNQRQCNHSFSLSHNQKQDSQKIIEIIASLRNTLSVLPEDPHILYNSENKSSEDVDTSALTESKTICEEILTQGKSLDLVGFLANGTIYHGFANSRGQKNWFETNLFSFDWSLYEKEDKAIKSQYSGKTWDEHTFHKKFEHTKLQAQLIKNEYKTIEPGSYRVYLAPSAFAEIIELLCWDGFSGKSFSTKTSSLQLVYDKKKQLSNNFTISQKNSNKTSSHF